MGELSDESDHGDARTPGWPAPDRTCLDWTAEQHRQVACDLLDGVRVPTASDDAWNGAPPHRHYIARDDDDRLSDPPDYGPYFAAITHALLALTTPPAQTTGGTQ